MLKKILFYSLILIAVSIGCVLAFTDVPGRVANPEADGGIKYNVVVEGSRTLIIGEYISIGSGVLISEDGLIVTAKHVVKHADSVRITLYDGRIFDANKWYEDPKNDVAIIDLPIEVNEYTILTDSNEIKSGDRIYNIGNVRGIWDNTIIYGKVHRTGFKRLMLGRDCEFIFATKMDIAPGCSGGGVYRGDDLIGIVVMRSPGATFIIPSNICNKAVEDYRCQQKRLPKPNIDSCKGWLPGLFDFLE